MMDLSTPTSATPLPVWQAQDLAAATGGIWHDLGGTPAPFARIITNTKLIQPGDVFLALIGERFDAHHFARDAVAQGASALIVSRQLADIRVPQLVVADTRLALGHLGAARRMSYPDLTTLALTGSSGKTTTKEMIGSILRAASNPDQVLVTRGNLNNDLGVPMMLLELTPEHRYAVMELGANHVGEIGYTTALVRPQVAGVLNIGTAHVGEFGGRAGIAKAKSEIFQGLPADGIAIVPAQGDFHDVIHAAASAYTHIRFGGDRSNSDIYATDIELLPTSSRFTLHLQGAAGASDNAEITLPLAGAHNVENALAAAAFARALGVSLAIIATGLGSAPTTKGRLNFITHTLSDATVTLIDDTYNANPHSMRAAADVLIQQAGQRVMVMGDIGELGDRAVDEHYQLGVHLAALPLDAVFAVGHHAPDIARGFAGSAVAIQAFADKQALLPALAEWVATARKASSGTNHTINVLFKGSRFMQMETLISALTDTLSTASDHTSSDSVTQPPVSETR